MIIPSGRKAGIWELVGVGAVNGLIIGTGLALAHRADWIPFGVGVATFITLTYALSCRRAAKPGK